MWRIWKIKINKWNWPIPSCINPPKFMYIFIWTQPGGPSSKKARSRLDWEDIWSLFQCCGHHLGWWVKRPHPKAASSYCQRAAKSTKAKSIRENVDVGPAAALVCSILGAPVPIPKYQLRKLFILVGQIAANGFCKEMLYFRHHHKSHQYICFWPHPILLVIPFHSIHLLDI